MSSGSDGFLFAHEQKLEAAGHTRGRGKVFVDRKPHTMRRRTCVGRGAFQEYREGMMQVLCEVTA